MTTLREAALEQHEKDVEWMKQRHANWRLQQELAEQTPERDKQQQEYEEARSAALEQPTRAQKMRDAGYTRRPTTREISALEQPEQEPVAWACFKNGELQTELIGTEADVNFWCASDEPEVQGMVKVALYTHPPRREWRGLTDVEWMNIVNKNHAWGGMQPDEVAHEVCKLTEAKLKEKNHD